MTPLDQFTLFFTAALVIMVYSFFLYKDNLFFHIAENLALAVALANATVVAIESLYSMTVLPAMSGKDPVMSAFWIAALVLGALSMARLSKHYSWLTRWPLAFIVGSGIGLGLRGAVETQLLANIKATVLPLVGGRTTPLDNIVWIIFPASIVAYFIFSKEHKEAWGIVCKIARYAMMFAFGAQFGSVTITRISSLGVMVAKILQAFGLAH